jgi:hypothetical protein
MKAACSRAAARRGTTARVCLREAEGNPIRRPSPFLPDEVSHDNSPFWSIHNHPGAHGLNYGCLHEDPSGKSTSKFGKRVVLGKRISQAGL